MKQAAASAESAAEPADKELAKEKSSAGGGKGGLSLEESVKKADRFFADQNWSAAAVAYRDLLNRFPSHKHAPKWRERMGQSLIAQQQQPETTGKKAAKSSDVLNGAKD
jgi:hypothetical protein